MPVQFFLFLLFLPLLGVSAAQLRKLVWRERAPLPMPRAGYMAGVINGKYVIAGGSWWADGQKQWTSEVDIFDPGENIWSKSAPLPEPRSDAASVAYDNGLYVFGGTAHGVVLGSSLEYRNGNWAELPEADLREPLFYPVAVECKGAVYLLGGMSKVGDYTTVRNSFCRWRPNSPHKGWETLPPIPGPGLINQAAAVFKGKIYVLGGATCGGKDVVNVNSAFEFDPETNQWKQLPNLPISRRAWWGVSAPDGILLFGGYTNDFEREVFAYQLPSEVLVPVGLMPHAFCDAKFLRIGGSLIATGGEVGDKLRGKSTIEAYLPWK